MRVGMPKILKAKKQITSSVIEMSQTRTSARRKLLAVLAIGAGALKFYLHYNSVFRYGLFDYVVAAGAVAGGSFLLYRKRSKIIVLVSLFFIIAEALKAVVDHRDIYDVLFAVITICYLTVPFFRLRVPKSS